MNPEDAIRRWSDAYVLHDPTGVGSIYAPDAVTHDPFYPDPLNGSEGTRKDAENFMKAFPDVRVQILNLVSRGDLVMGELS